MGNCVSVGEGEQADLNPILTHPVADNVVNISEPPPEYESLVVSRPAELSCRTYAAKFDYDSRAHGELSFKKGDHFFVIGSDEGDRWYAQHQGTSKVGYVPSSFMEPKIFLESELWYFGKMKRMEAHRMLMHSMNGHGSYIVRESGSCAGDIAISVRYHKSVRHFLIKRLCSGAYYIARRATFESVHELVAHYQKQADGLGVNLRLPCIPVALPSVLPTEGETTS